MIQPVLPPACYTEEHWFKREKEKIFGQLWLLAGLTQQLETEDSFISRDLSGIPVLIQNIGGKLYAFRNACTHRGVPIQIAESGKRKMICPYHGWSFGNDGSLRGVPNAQIYNLSEADKAAAHLHRYALEIVGNFVFVNLSEDPLPITEQFPDYVLETLKEVSPLFAKEVSYTHFTGEYNWKINFENILDWNHILFVHGQTFAPLLEYNKGGVIAAAKPGNTPIFGGKIPATDTTKPPRTDPPALKDLSYGSRTFIEYAPHWYADFFDSPCDRGTILSCHLFPNMNFGSVHGEYFYLQQYVPLDAEHIEFHSWIFHTRLKPHVPPQPHLLWGLHHCEKRVVDEDIAIFNALQKALRSANTVGTMGDYERPLESIGKWYMANLAGQKAI